MAIFFFPITIISMIIITTFIIIIIIIIIRSSSRGGIGARSVALSRVSFIILSGGLGSVILSAQLLSLVLHGAHSFN